MSTAVAISTAAAVQASSASAEAAAARIAAKRAECKADMIGFNNDVATVAQRQEYATCVEIIHPLPSEPPSAQDKLVVGSIAVYFLIAAIIGAYLCCKEIGGFLSLIYGAFVGAAVAFFLGLFGWGIWELFSYLTA